MTLNVLSVASEAVPLVKTGGLADVVGALPGALAPHDVSVTTLLPGYPAVIAAVGDAPVVHGYEALLGTPARILAAELAGHPLRVLDAPALYARDGGLYGDADGQDWSDNWRRFAALAHAGADLASGALGGGRFDLLHAHDWQAALAPAYLAFGAAPAVPSVLTIHNLAFQGWFEGTVFAELGLPQAAWSDEGVEHYGGVGFLKAGLNTASGVTTVSPTYAAEIGTPEFGMGLDGVIASRRGRVHGILNGIDTAEWNPATDPRLAAPFDAAMLDRRARSTCALEAEFALAPGDGPLFVVVSRLTQQKGIDVLAAVLDHLVAAGGRLALLGAGEPELEAACLAAAARYPGRIAAHIGYDEALAHRMQAGGNAILIPSRFEPCGLTQLYGLAYGCVPVVARTGGLADTVIDANLAALRAGVATGIAFDGVTTPALSAAIDRTIALFGEHKTWRAIQRNGMAADFSWARSGRAYADLFRALIEGNT